MTERTILLLGGGGQLGFESQRTLPALGHVIVRDFPNIDFSRPETLRDVVRKLRPAVIVNAAAYTVVDKAESDEAKAHAINAEAPGVLAEEGRCSGCYLRALLH